MYILGINAYHGDVSAVLIKEGHLVAAIEEERFRRVKHWAGFPTQAIQTCLAVAGIDGAQVNHVAISRDPKANLLRKIKFVVTKKPALQHVLDRAKNARNVLDVKGPLAEALGIEAGGLPTLHYVEHHPAHLASAFFVSPFEEAAVCAIDAFGDFVSTSLAQGTGNRLDILDKVYFPHSLGQIYTAITQYLGFRNYGDEYKVMGLAPYGKPVYVDTLRELVHLKDDGLFELNLKYFRFWKDEFKMDWEEGYPRFDTLYSDALETLLGPARKPDEPVAKRHENMARSLQAVYEHGAFHVLNGLWERTRAKRLCLAGGCAMNSVANGKIRAQTPFEEVYIQPAAADNGTALGAAYYVWNQVLGQPRTFVMDHAYWGTAHPAPEITSLLAGRDDADWRYHWASYDSDEALCRATAGLLAEGLIIGWFQGRMEWGARALGNRSILADPRRADARELINTKIKFRERFRPFAPSILEEALDDYFVDAAPDPFMQQVYPVREDKQAVIPAVTHVDGTGRLQTVNARTNPLYHSLIKQFETVTGVPVLLNTSFNENEPIVDTPQQALDCFFRTRMDAVIINRTLIRRYPRHADTNGTPSLSSPSEVDTA